MYWQLYKIKYGPVPPVPQIKIEYSIEDRMSATNYADLHSYWDSNPLCAGQVLTNDGKIVQQEKATQEVATQNCKQRKLVNQQFAKKHHIVSNNPKSKFPDFSVIAFNKRNHALVQDFRPTQTRWKLWSSRNKLKTVVEIPSSYPKWRNWCFQEFHQLNIKDEVIGNVWLSTGCASSGGLSEPHGRLLPLLWRGTQTQDINSLIDPKSGWYLLKAIDINDQSQILCLAIKGNAVDAEKYNDIAVRFVVLTPLK